MSHTDRLAIGRGTLEARHIDSILIALASGAVLGLTLIAQGRTTDAGFTYPMHSPNDRSRFATVRALGDHGTYAIENIIEEPGWGTIDKLRRTEAGVHHIYSTKPPLLPTLLAWEYRVIRALSGGRLTFAEHPQAVVRALVLSVNLVPFVAYLLLYSRLLDRLTTSPWTRTYCLAAAAGGTYLTGFCVTLNNHTVAAFSSFFALYSTYRIWSEGARDWWLFALAGFFASFAAVIELPAVAFALALFLGLAWRAPARTLGLFLPFALLPLAGHFYTTYQATGGWLPAYADKQAYDFPGSYWKIDPTTGRLVGSETDPVTKELIIGSPKGIDNQYEPWFIYLFHMLVGHHGVFSLSPIFVLAVFGWFRAVRMAPHPLTAFGGLAFGLTALLLVFYTFFAGHRNYGGMTNGLRWLFWVIPLWLMFLPAGIEPKESCRWFRRAAIACLVISAASALYATRNPWTRPWLHELLHQAGWIGY